MTQEEYVAYHSPSARASRLAMARAANEAAVTEAHRMFFEGDVEGARHRLFFAGLGDDGIAFYLREWGENALM